MWWTSFCPQRLSLPLLTREELSTFPRSECLLQSGVATGAHVSGYAFNTGECPVRSSCLPLEIVRDIHLRLGHCSVVEYSASFAQSPGRVLRHSTHTYTQIQPMSKLKFALKSFAPCSRLFYTQKPCTLPHQLTGLTDWKGDLPRSCTGEHQSSRGTVLGCRSG